MRFAKGFSGFGFFFKSTNAIAPAAATMNDTAATESWLTRGCRSRTDREAVRAMPSIHARQRPYHAT